MSTTLIAPEDLPKRARLFDVRMGPGAAAAYQEGHLGSAHFVDVEEDLTGDASDPAKGGRHPLPDLDTWCRTLGQLGVTRETWVVAYDDAGGAKAAARLWWMLRAVGHEHVWVLDGGMEAAIAAGVPVTRSVPTRMPLEPYPADAWALPTRALDALEGVCLLDVRTKARFDGDEEPYDPPGGHIPGAINVPLESNLGDDGRFKARGELRKLYTDVLGDAALDDVVVSCGSGITACHTLLALEHAGLSGAALYVGSYSEWSRSGRPTETK